MCGIVGIASTVPVTQRDWLTAGGQTLRHRGPDAQGLWWDPSARVGLAHRRLAIIDLSAAAEQPMRDAAGRLAIVFNGEIYNFRELRDQLHPLGHAFRTDSDTEVLLAAYRQWGADCLLHLNGMFAFALHDAERGQLLLARDRAGEKPLFYALAGGELRFASELKALLADPSFTRRIDPAALDCYLSMGFVPSPGCILEGVEKLPPAHAMTFDLARGEARTWRYWSLPDLDAEADAQSEDALLDELEALLADSVRRQLVADVPVGVLLSGGVDSSLVAALAARAHPRIKTFTVRFPGAGRYDESAHARLIAEHFGTEHTVLDAEPATAQLLPALARQFDEPLIDSSMIPTSLLSGLVRRHCTVALGGDGGDELFGGYAHYDRLLTLQQRVGAWPKRLRGAAAPRVAALLPAGFKGRQWLAAAGADFDVEAPLVARYFDVAQRQRLVPGSNPAAAEAVWSTHARSGSDLLQRATRADFATYLPEDILVKVDRASMLHSLEVRAPMLDHRLVEFAFARVPSRLKARLGQRKVLLKRLAERLLPPAFDRQRKQGFSIPMHDWLAGGPFLDALRDALLDGGQHTFDRREVQRLFDGQRRGLHNGERLFGLAMFELWRRAYGTTL